MSSDCSAQAAEGGSMQSMQADTVGVVGSSVGSTGAVRRRWGSAASKVGAVEPAAKELKDAEKPLCSPPRCQSPSKVAAASPRANADPAAPAWIAAITRGKKQLESTCLPLSPSSPTLPMTLGDGHRRVLAVAALGKSNPFRLLPQGQHRSMTPRRPAGGQRSPSPTQRTSPYKNAQGIKKLQRMIAERENKEKTAPRSLSPTSPGCAELELGGRQVVGDGGGAAEECEVLDWSPSPAEMKRLRRATSPDLRAASMGSPASVLSKGSRVQSPTGFIPRGREKFLRSIDTYEVLPWEEANEVMDVPEGWVESIDMSSLPLSAAVASRSSPLADSLPVEVLRSMGLPPRRSSPSALTLPTSSALASWYRGGLPPDMRYEHVDDVANALLQRAAEERLSDRNTRLHGLKQAHRVACSSTSSTSFASSSREGCMAGGYVAQFIRSPSDSDY
eukprot:TRINITY_DN48490_c0_g1_i1.p1 TRINITY_DN48490_c0_g1~~TRINITY_DN48490_c0_g1_i1.p1  ORF type:complete len:447 (+),score=81.12 TRINITY_DN48490_c0_g1_i1:70-1410(+)